jgi:hypothetical protein
MKKFIITEGEKKRILGLYEQNNSGSTQQNSTNFDTKKFGVNIIWKYKDQLQNIVKLLVSVFPVNDMTDYSEFKLEYCGANQSKLDPYLKSKLTPIFGVIDDFFVRLKTDLKVGTVNEAIKILYNSFNDPVFQGIIKFIGTLVSKGTPMATEIVLELQNYLRSKYGEDGSLFSSVLSGILGKIDVEYFGICKYM